MRDMKLKFIADIHISPVTVEALQNKAHHIIWCKG